MAALLRANAAASLNSYSTSTTLSWAVADRKTIGPCGAFEVLDSMVRAIASAISAGDAGGPFGVCAAAGVIVNAQASKVQVASVEASNGAVKACGPRQQAPHRPVNV